MFWQDLGKARGLVLGGFGVQAAMVGCLFSYGVFVPAIEAELGWSRAWLSAGSTVVLLLMGALAFPAGALVDRLGAAGLLRFAAVLTGLAFWALGLVTEPWHLIVGFSLLSGVALSVHDVGTLSPVARRFPDNRGAVTGVVKTGTALGQTVVPFVAAALIAGYGWRDAAWMLGFCALFVLLIAAHGMANKKGQREASLTQPKTSQQTGLSLAEARRTRNLWTFCLIQFCFFPALMTVPVHLVSHGQELGLGSQQAAWTLSTIGACSAIGRLSVGFLFDRLGAKGSLLLCLSLLFVSLITLRLIDTPVYLYWFAAFYGLSHGGLFTAVSPSLAAVFGMRAHAALFGIVLMSGTFSGALMQYMAGVWHDHDGDYRFAFSAIAVMAAFAFIAALTLPKASS